MHAQCPWREGSSTPHPVLPTQGWAMEGTAQVQKHCEPAGTRAVSGPGCPQPSPALLLGALQDLVLGRGSPGLAEAEEWRDRVYWKPSMVQVRRDGGWALQLQGRWGG